MYKQYFHFKERPFSIAPDPNFLYMSRRHQEGLAHLLYGIKSGGFVVLTGEVGTGKTTLCHCLLQQLPDDVDIALILNPKLDSLELLANICDELGIQYATDKAGLKEFTDVLNKYLLDAHARGRRTVLMIDEAQNLSLEVLEQIRLLTNLETSKNKLLQIVLVGQPELKKLLNRKELRQLNQRITARYHLEPLTAEETNLYIQHRLTVGGGDGNIFKRGAVRRIHVLSKGIPRLINILCDRALLGAYASGVKSVTPKIVNKAATEALDLEGERFPHIQMFFLLIVLLVTGLIVFNLLAHYEEDPAALTVTTHPQSTMAASAIKAPTQSEWVGSQSDIVQESKESGSMSTAKIEEKESDVVSLVEFLTDPGYSLANSFTQALALWGERIPEDKAADCNLVTDRGFRCLIDHGSLKEVLGFNRPVILEFVLPNAQRRHALWVGMDRGYPMIRSLDDEDRVFRLEEMLNYWQGDYLILWKTPLTYGMRGIYPYRYSPNVLWLREKLDAIDGQNSNSVAQAHYFDEQLVARVKEFQKRHHLRADGIVGPKTILFLQNVSASDHHPKLKHIE